MSGVNLSAGAVENRDGAAGALGDIGTVPREPSQTSDGAFLRVPAAVDTMTARILAADDDEYVRVIVETKLGDEYDVVTVPDGADAWDYLTDPDHERPALVILDVMMPEMDGFRTLEQIRGRSEFESLPTILLTSRGREEDVLRALELGADDFLTKPFSPAELEARVKRILE